MKQIVHTNFTKTRKYLEARKLRFGGRCCIVLDGIVWNTTVKVTRLVNKDSQIGVAI